MTRSSGGVPPGSRSGSAPYPPGIRAAQYETLFTLLLVVSGADGMSLPLAPAAGPRVSRRCDCGRGSSPGGGARATAAARAGAEPPRAGSFPAGSAAWRRSSLLALVIALAPWVARNRHVYGVFMPTTRPMLPAIRARPSFAACHFQRFIPQLADLAPYGNDDHRFAVARIGRSQRACRAPRRRSSSRRSASGAHAGRPRVALRSSAPPRRYGASFAMQAGLWRSPSSDCVAAAASRKHLWWGRADLLVVVHWMVSIRSRATSTRRCRWCS